MGAEKTTALYAHHLNLKAKMIPFAGFSLPVQYSGIIREHQAVRTAAGLFDVSHMGEIIVSGLQAEAFLQYVTINDIQILEPGQAQYSAMCDDDGGIIDDLIIYRFIDHFLIVVNANNIEKDYEWLEDHLISDVSVENVSDSMSMISLQGPRSSEILGKILLTDINMLPYYHFTEDTLAGKPVMIARTGYTGERGYELYADNDDITSIWDQILGIGDRYGLVPVGLGARDTLRLEMKYCLYGQDIDETTNPIEAGLGWITKVDKGNFIGRDALVKAKQKSGRKLAGFEMLTKAVPRSGYSVFAGEKKIGYVTSGSQSPSLQKGIGLAYLIKPYFKTGTEIDIDVRGTKKKAVVVKTPFYKNGSLLS